MKKVCLTRQATTRKFWSISLLMQPHTYIYFDENYVPYYVGEGSRRRYIGRHTQSKYYVPVPPENHILVFPQDCQEAACAFEEWLIKRIGRRADCCGNRVDEKIGPLINKTDGCMGLNNPWKAARPRLAQGGLHAGAITGRQHVVSGQMSRVQSLGGKVMGQRHHVSGLLARAQATSNHVRWHVNRGILKPECPWCQP